MSVCDQPLMPGEGGARWHWTPARVEVAVLAWSRAAEQLWLVLVITVLGLGEAETLLGAGTSKTDSCQEGCGDSSH